MNERLDAADSLVLSCKFGKGPIVNLALEQCCFRTKRSVRLCPNNQSEVLERDHINDSAPNLSAISELRGIALNQC